MKAIVTGGGTVEAIDDVRTIGNNSKGRFAIEISRVLAAAGIETTLLGSEFLGQTTNDAAGEPFAFRRFRSYADLEALLKETIREEVPDLIFMAAAVSDYRPVPYDGKIPSDAEEMTIRLVKNPKLLATLRELCGVKTFIVGFKLLSGVSKNELIATALKQTRSNRINLTVANDLKNLTGGLHPIVMVTPEGGALPVEGAREDVARQLVSFVLKRQAVQWFRTVEVPAADRLEVSQHTLSRAQKLLAMAQESGLLHDSNGNLSVRELAGEGMLVSPRQVNKGEVTVDSFATAVVDCGARVVRYSGSLKSSIDTGVQGELYRNLPKIVSLLHFHPGSALVLPNARTTFPFPCGTVEEAAEILSTLAKAEEKSSPFNATGDFLLELEHHGYLLGLSPAGERELLRSWCEVREQYLAHLRSIHGDSAPSPLLSPLFSGPNVVGVIATFRCEDGAASSLYLPERHRGHGLGIEFTALLRERGDRVVAHTDCKVESYYKGWGYQVQKREGELVFLTSPVSQTSRVKCATMVLVNPRERKVLVGRRLTPPWPNVYALPGGRLEPGEGRFEGMVREVWEETGLQVTAPEYSFEPVPIQEYVANDETVFDVNTYVGLTLSSADPIKSAEMEAVWTPFESVFELKLGPATRRVLRRVIAAH